MCPCYLFGKMEQCGEGFLRQIGSCTYTGISSKGRVRVNTYDTREWRLQAEINARDAEIASLTARLAAAEAVMERCKLAVIEADSELSAYGHGRHLDKDVAISVSAMCRKSYKEIVAWMLNRAAKGGRDE